MENAAHSFRTALRPHRGLDVTPRAKRLFLISAAGVLVFIALVLGYPDIMHFLRTSSEPQDPGIPNSFSGNRAAYGFALFSLFSITSLSIRKIFLLAAQLRDEHWRNDPDVGFHRMALTCLLLVIVMGAGPDVILLLIWGEVGGRSLATAMTFDRMCDGLAVIPFVTALFLHIRAERIERRPALAQLSSVTPPIPVRAGERQLFVVQPRTESIAENVKIVVFVMLIAALLALLK